MSFKFRLISIRLVGSFALCFLMLILNNRPLQGQTTIAQQDFDGSTPTWYYSTNVPLFDNGWDSDGRFDIVPNSEWNPDLDSTILSGKILGINDLDDEGDNGTEETAKITFEKVNISGYNNVDVTFDYDFNGSWAGDFLKYQVFEDGVGQGVVTIVDGNTKEGTETVSISSSADNVKLAFRIKQNSAADYGGIDNLKLEGTAKSQNEPANQPTNFSADSLTNGKIKLTWTDASGTSAPDGYLIKAVDQNNSISAPSDGNDPSIDKDLSDGSAVVKVGHGTGGSYTFSGLSKDTEYDFQIWSFTNAEGNIDFLTSSKGPTDSTVTFPNENILTESFESTSGYTYPNGNGGSGNDFFDRTDIIDYPPTTDHIYSGFDQSYFIAGEDIDGVSNTNSDDGQVLISSIDITDYQDLKVKGLVAAGANSGYESSDGVEVEIKVDDGSWTTIADIEGNTNGKLQEDSDLDGTPDGTILDGSFEDFVWDVSQTGDQMSVRITMSFNANSEEAAFDNIRVSGKAPKKWNGGTTGNWSNANNWDPNGVPEHDDIVVLDDTHVTSDYTVNVDTNLANTGDSIVQSIKVLPGSTQTIDVVRENALTTFKLTGSGTVLTIGDGGTFTDKSGDGLPDNFSNSNGEMLIKSGGTYQVLNNNTNFNSGNLVASISSSSSADGNVIIQSTGQLLSVSGNTYPTGLSLKDNTGSGISYTTSGSNPFTIEGDFTIGSNVTYDASSRTGDLAVKGDFVNNGTINLNDSKQDLELKGKGGQNLQGISSVNNMEVNNGVDVQLDQTLTIKDSLKLKDGIVKFSNSNDTLTIADGAKVDPAGGKKNAYVAGPVKKIGNEAFTFPLGDNGQRARLGISAPSNASDAFSASYDNSSYSDTSTGDTLNNVSDVEYWNLVQNKGNSSVDVTLYWEDGSSSGSNVDNINDLVVAHWNETKNEWENFGQSSSSGTTNSGSITANNVSNFSPFTLGSKSSSDNALPVELLYFKVAADQDQVNLDWATASETNNKHFKVQKQVGEQWVNIGTVKGNGTTIEKQTYHFRDANVQSGKTHYYRLKQVDHDGSYEYSDVKAVTIKSTQQDEDAQVALYPNPVEDQLNLKLRSNNNADYKLEILSSRGEMVYKDEVAVQAGLLNRKLPVSDLKPGVYVLTLRGKEQVFHRRFIKQ